jgi:hypothetical protein
MVFPSFQVLSGEALGGAELGRSGSGVHELVRLLSGSAMPLVRVR